MYCPIESQKSCATAWLEATKFVNQAPQHEASNVIVDINDPLLRRDMDVQITEEVDKFLIDSGCHMPLQSVANTIFPIAIYEKHGSPNFYDVYTDKIYKKIMAQPGQWGRYFDRMIRRTTADGHTINPLEIIVAKMRDIVDGNGRRYRNNYELDICDLMLDLSIYDPFGDAKRIRNRQCLSFLSFKLDKDFRIHLTATYRNHYYIGRLLGNLIGLAHLMAFISAETSADVGHLTIVSTYANVETPNGYGRSDVERLLRKCSSF